MTLWAYRQDNTIPGCGDTDCCWEWEDIEWVFRELPKPLTEAKFIEQFGGGPVLEMRIATDSEMDAYGQGVNDGWDQSERHHQENMEAIIQEKLEHLRKTMLDPKTLTPEELYRLQSETWAQGVAYERNRINSWLNRIRTWYPAKSEMFHDGMLTERIRIIKLIEDTYNRPEYEEHGSFIFSQDVVDLIQEAKEMSDEQD